MKLFRILYWTLQSVLFIVAVTFCQSEFQADSVYQHIYFLSEVIGPRPMGSAAERRGLEWMREKLIAYGADSAYIMPFTQSEAKNNYANTRSGTVVGIFRGVSDTAIVVAGHMDSTPAASPGANDNASGTATVIELARIWSQRPRHYTMIFASFGGEEQGLYGSNHFVEKFIEIEKVALMICIDMAGGEDDILAMMEIENFQSPKWLIRDAFEIDRQLGIRRLKYPTHLATINNLGRGAGSDHIPFLRKRIPAIDFTAGINTSPIHSAQDRIAHIDRQMLAHCGHLVDGLLQKYQGSYFPAKSAEKYMLWQPFGILWFIPYWFIRAAIAVAIIIGVVAYWYSLRDRLSQEKEHRVKFSGLRVAAVLAIVVIVSQLGEALVQAMKGIRYPWYLHVEAYLLLMAAWAVAGLWLALAVTYRWRWNEDGHLYASRALILFFIPTILLSLVYGRLAFYFALSLFTFALAVLVGNSLAKTIFVLFVPLPLTRLIFSEGTPFIARTICQSGFFIDSTFKAALFSVALGLGLFLLYLPSAYAAAYAAVRVPILRKLFTLFRRPLMGFSVFVGLFMVTFWAYHLPAYNDVWRPTLRAEANYHMPKRESQLKLVSNEYFQNVTVEADTFNTVLSGRKHVQTLPLRFTADWLRIEGEQLKRDGTRDTLDVNWRLISTQPWYDVTCTIKSDTLDLADVHSDLRNRHNNGFVKFHWRCFPPETLAVNARFTIQPNARLIRKIMANYNQLPLPLMVTAPHANVYFQTTVTWEDTLTFDIMRSDNHHQE